MLCCRVETSLVRCKGTRRESLYMQRSAGQACFFRTPCMLRSRSCPWSCVFLSSISLCRYLAIFRRRQGGVSYAGRFLRACARWIAPTRSGRTSRRFACCSVMSHGLGRNAFFQRRPCRACVVCGRISCVESSRFLLVGIPAHSATARGVSAWAKFVRGAGSRVITAPTRPGRTAVGSVADESFVR